MTKKLSEEELAKRKEISRQKRAKKKIDQSQAAKLLLKPLTPESSAFEISEELATLFLVIKKDLQKNLYRKNLEAGLRARKNLRLFSKISKVLIKKTIQLDNETKAKRKLAMKKYSKLLTQGKQSK